MTADAEVKAAADLIIDTLRINRTYLLVPNDLRFASRPIQSILDAFLIRDEKLQALLRLLKDAGQLQNFFNLASPKNDTGMKKYLLANGVYWETVLAHHDFDTWDGLEFGRGFIMGLGASFASILEALWELLGFTLKACGDPKGTLEQVTKLVAGLKELSAGSLQQIASDAWDAWQKSFSEALFDLRFDRAGYLLGKLGGDLWQLLTGIKALTKLPGMTLQAARKLGVLFSAGARSSAKALALLGDMLLKLGPAITDAAEIGFGAMAGFLDDTALLVSRLRAGALAIVDDVGRTLFVIPQEGVVLAGVGKVDAGFLLTDSTGQVVARTRVEFDKAYRYAERLMERVSKQVKKVKLTPEHLKELRKAQVLAEEFLKVWRKKLPEILQEINLGETQKKRLLLNPREFGVWIHGQMEEAFGQLAVALGKRYQSVAEVDIKTLAQMLAEGAELKLFESRANTPLLEFVKQHPRVFAAFGVKDEAELVAYLRRLGGYKSPSKTRIGELICDGVLFDPDTKTLMSVDWSSGWSKVDFANELERIVKAGGTVSETRKVELAREFLTHAYREYALREAILEFVLEGWRTKVLEVLYAPVKLRR